MPLLKFILFSFLSFFIGQAFALDSEDLLPVEKAFKITANATSNKQIMINLDIAPGYYLYKDKLKAISQTPGIELLKSDFPKGQIKQDDYFGDMEIYRGKLSIPVKLQSGLQNTDLKLLLKHQGCADIGVCYPPQKTLLNIDLPNQTSISNAPLNNLLQDIRDIKLDLFQDSLLPADQAFQFFVEIKDPQTLIVNWHIAEDYYLYRGKINLSLVNSQATQLGQYQVPSGEKKHDEAFGDVEILRNQLSFEVPLIRTNQAPETITLLAKYQGCADRGVCYPPMQTEETFELPVAIQTSSVSPPGKNNLSEQQQIVQALKNDSLWLTLLSFFGFGLLLSLTPCIFPMIPILSGIIVGHGEHISSKRGFLLSLCFVVASAITYMVFGIIAAIFGSNLQAYLQEPWVIIAFSALFVLLSLSMFGFYNLEIPKSWQRQLHNTSEVHRNTGYFGVAIMGALSALIVGPCVAAPLAGALIYIGQTGDVTLGGSALFVMGLGMGAPLLLIGASAGSLLPKAGPWLNTTKSIFGVLMLAIAVWMLERVVPAELSMLLWAILLIIPAIYLNAIDPLPSTASNWQKFWKGTGLISLIYGTLILIGLGMGNSNPLKPLTGLNNTQIAKQSGPHFEPVSSIAELHSQIQKAAANGQWVMLDFYADWCISCKEMEAYTFTDPQVKQQLNKLVLLQADVTKNSTDDLALLKQFQLIGPPAILFFDPAQKERLEFRVIGYQNAETFITQLKKINS